MRAILRCHEVVRQCQQGRLALVESVRLVTAGRPRQPLRSSDPLAAALFEDELGAAPNSRFSNSTSSSPSAQEAALGMLRTHASMATPPRAREAYRDTSSAVLETLEARLRTRVAEDQQALMTVPIAELVARVQHYLNATRRVQLVSAQEEHVLFPVLNERLEELSVDDMLEIVSCHWSRSTLVRYGAALQDRIRDRIATIAVRAGQQLQHPSKGDEAMMTSEEPDTTEADDGVGTAEVVAEKENDMKVDVEGDVRAETVSREADPLLATAASVMDAPTVLRCLTVMGLSAGHRKRDVEFFQVLGSFVVFHINRYHDSQDLVRAITALSRAKIVPPESFLALIARRLPVLHKTTPLTTLSAYRVMVNLSKMGYKHMNVFRFLADSMLRTMQANIARTPGHAGQQDSPVVVVPRVELEQTTGLKPSMFTKWLSVLGLTGAPHQQYLRPLVVPLIVPALPSLAPPSFSRLLVAVYRFKSTDLDLLEPLLDHVVVTLVPAGRLRRTDALTLLRILTFLGDENPPRNVDVFFDAVRVRFANDATTQVESATAASRLSSSSVMRPHDMCVVAQCVAHYQTRTTIPLDAMAPLLALLEDFAQVLSLWTELGVVSLGHVDQFLMLCLHNVQHPDAAGHLARLHTIRQRVDATDTASSSSSSSGPEAGDEYYDKLDIDVRELFESLSAVNDAASSYQGFKPIPGPLLVDFRELLARCSVLDVLEAVDLFERSCPGSLTASAKLVVTRSVLAKLTQSGEEVIADDGRKLELRASLPLLLTRDDLTRMATLIQRCPLEKVRESHAVWSALQTTARQLGVNPEVLESKAS